MKPFICALLFFCLTSTYAEARGHRGAVSPECNVTMPCDLGGPNFLSGVRSIHVTMHRDHKAKPARVARTRHHKTESATPSVSGVVRATSGAVAYVAHHATEAFQCLINKLEAQGYHIHEMGGYARGGHIRHSLHYSGRALDVNQLSRGVTKPHMPANEIELANSCGLISGAQWVNNDSGHFQLGGYAGRKPLQMFADQH